jgi:hypothetical protein
VQIKGIRHGNQVTNPGNPSIKKIKVKTMHDQPYLQAEKNMLYCRL